MTPHFHMPSTPPWVCGAAQNSTCSVSTLGAILRVDVETSLRESEDGMLLEGDKLATPLIPLAMAMQVKSSQVKSSHTARDGRAGQGH